MIALTLNFLNFCGLSNFIPPVKIRASTLNFLNFCGLSNIIFIQLSGEKSQFNPQLSQLFQPLYSVSKINWKKLRKLRVEAIIL